MNAASPGVPHIRGPYDASDPSTDGLDLHSRVPMGPHLLSMCLSLITLPVLGACLTRRIQRVRKWSQLPVSAAFILLVYSDSFLFIFVTALFKDVGVNRSPGVCRGAILLCLTSYLSTKVFIYLFLAEKAWIVRGRLQRRRDSWLYLFNCFGMMLPYSVVIALNFLWRKARIDQSGICIIGVEKSGMIPLIAFEAIINMYLNVLFILPLRKLYSYRHGDGKMRTLALRTFIGSCGTLISSSVNLTVLMALDGEPGWICLLLCNADILFCTLVLHWATAHDSGGSPRNEAACRCSHPSHHTTMATVPSLQIPDLDVCLPRPPDTQIPAQAAHPTHKQMTAAEMFAEEA